MTRSLLISATLAVAALAAPFVLPLPAALDGFAQAQQKGASRTDPFSGFGANSKEPIRIDANRLEVFDKDQKAIYSGDVVAVRGATTTRCTTMIIFYDNTKNDQTSGAASTAARTPAANAAQPGQEGALKKIEFHGAPGKQISVVNAGQTAVADIMIYDAVAKTVTLRGNATVADGSNVQRGELMVYNTEASVATITNPNGRVQGVFTPGSEQPGQARPRR